jgi:hypothetical protein
MTFAAANAVPAMIPKPSSPAIRAMIRKAMAQFSMMFSLTLRRWAKLQSLRPCSERRAHEAGAQFPNSEAAEFGNDGDVEAFSSHRNSTKENWNAHGIPYQGGGTS